MLREKSLSRRSPTRAIAFPPRFLDRRNRLFRAVRIDIDYGHCGAFGGETQRTGAADAGRSPRDKASLPRKSH